MVFSTSLPTMRSLKVVMYCMLLEKLSYLAIIAYYDDSDNVMFRVLSL